MSEILEKANELGKMLADSNELKHFRAMEAVFYSDEEAQKVFNHYQEKREEITNQMHETEMSPEALRSFQEQLQACMAELTANQVVNDYLEAKSAFHQIITKVNSIISYCIEGEENGSGGCGGHCSSCSGCH